MQFEIQTFRNGSASVLDLKYGETMHSLIGPLNEAKKVYLEQSQLERRLRLEKKDPLVLFDVGLGIGTNALASIELFSHCKPNRNLHIISFENNLSGIEFGLKNSGQLPLIQANCETIVKLLKQRKIHITTGGNEVFWELWEGDFREHLFKAPAPEVIFYDFYSPKTCPALWSLSTLKQVFQSTLARRAKNEESFLCTYSSATSVRSSLVLAGFQVGYGISTEGKKETTVASTSRGTLQNPLSQRWLDHWLRSSKPLPDDASIESHKKELFDAVQGF